MPRDPIKKRNERFTGRGYVNPGAGNKPRDYGAELISEISGRLGGKHTPAVEESFKRRGKRAYEKVKY